MRDEVPQPLVVPDKPFMLALGTSHTFGCCGDYADNKISGLTAHQQVAKQFGLECIVIGLPGCNNDELVQATNELATRGLFQDPNFKIMMLEARLVNGQSAVPYNSIAERPYIFTDPKTGGNNDYGRAPLESYLQESEYWGRGLVECWGDNDICNALYQSASMHNWRTDEKEKFWEPLNYPLDIQELAYAKKVLQTYKEVHILDGLGPAACLKDLVKIESIKNIAVNAGVKFMWESFDSRVDWYKIGKLMLGETSNLFDYCVDINATMRHHINCLDGVDSEGNYIKVDGPKSMELQCKCNHANEKGHIFWATKLKKQLMKVL